MLRSNQDAYGHQLYDLFKGRQVIEVVERDDGLIDPSKHSRSTTFPNTRTGRRVRNLRHNM